MGQPELYRFITEQVLENIIVFDMQGRIVMNNPVTVESLGCDCVEEQLSIGDVLPGVWDSVNNCLDRFSLVLNEQDNYNVYRKNKTCFPANGKIMLSESEQVYVFVFENMSGKQLLEKQATQAEQEVEEALKVKTQFVANVTHELRTPVNGILGNTRELLNRENDAEKLRILKLVERGCNDMHSIINNILDFSKLDAGKVVLDPQKFDFYEMIEYVKSNHINKITEKGLDFFINISPEVPHFIVGDELRIVQILNNLLSNATKFTSIGKIALEVVKTEQVGNRIELFFLVIDTGIGIDKAGQDKLFKSFSQVEASTTRKFGGTGLGLYISKQLVELMNGDIRVESEAGKGTMFSFHIWVELPEDDSNGEMPLVTMNSSIDEAKQSMMQKLYGGEETGEKDLIMEYGTEQNRQELEKKMSKLILSVEMENWEKAEMFADTVKQLTQTAPQEIKSAALRLKMAVQKGDHDKVVAAFETLKQQMQ